MVDATIIEAIENAELWRPWFRDRDSWAPWLTFLRGLFGLPLSADERAIFARHTGREPPPGGCAEAWLIVGRRGGKSQMMATIACFLAVFRDWSPFLVPGESALIQVVATDRRQARIVYRYARAMLTRVPVLKSLVVREQDEWLELSNGLSIEITTNSFRGVRGYTVVAALLDECAFWRSDDTANPDAETLIALRPAMATVPGSILIGASSPYAKRGVLYDAFRRHYGQDGPVLVWKATTREMHPTFPQAVVDAALEHDPASGAAEYLAEFRNDIEGFVSREIIDACTAPGRHELPPLDAHQRGLHGGYHAFVDPSGGSSDSMTLAIVHREGEIGVLDAVREVRAPFSPEGAVAGFAQLLIDYGIRTVVGDRYAGEWPREQFRKHMISYEPSERPKSDIYGQLLPLLNSHRVELLDHVRLTTQFTSLERRTARGGRDSIDHAPGGHDDIANAVAGAFVRIMGKPDPFAVWRRLERQAAETPRYRVASTASPQKNQWTVRAKRVTHASNMLPPRALPCAVIC